MLITHEHPDHFDVAALEWIRSQGLPVYANRVDAGSLHQKGLDVHELQQGALNMDVEIIVSRHGRGQRLKPDVIVAPAGAANMGLGDDILFSLDELVTLVRRAPGLVVLNHLEALDHCPPRASR